MKKIYIIGMGTGNENQLTGEAVTALERADVYIGSRRILDIYPEYRKKKYKETYKVEETIAFIDSQPEGTVIGVLFSGDIGYYSGAKNLASKLQQRDLLGQGEPSEVVMIPGIASPIYFLDKLGESWDDTILVSNHGQTINTISIVRDNPRVCSLIGKPDDVAKICKMLVAYGMGDVLVTVGQRLSYINEDISCSKASDLVDSEFDPLSVVFFENDNPRKKHITAGIPDDEFIRDDENGKPKTPMTKEEVRSLVISKLRLTEAAVFYDVGAGTGSISVETALLSPNIKVYAIEMRDTALEVLLYNKFHFAADNIELIKGMAPDILSFLPTPTHAFIGGSEGNLQGIIDAIREKNPDTRFVATAVTMETLEDFQQIVKQYPEYEETFELIQVGVTRTKKLGNHHMMMAENPIYLVAFGG